MVLLYYERAIFFLPGLTERETIFNFRSVTQSHLCSFHLEAQAPFSLSLEFDQINGHRRSVADLSIKKPFEACPKKEIKKCCDASSMCTILA